MKIVYALVCTLIIFNAARGGNLAITGEGGNKINVPPASITLPPITLGNPPSPDKSVSLDMFVPSAYAEGESVSTNITVREYRASNTVSVVTNIPVRERKYFY